MRIECHNGLTSPQVVVATRLVVKDFYGQPVFVVLEPEPNRFVTLKATEPGFRAALAQFGINLTAVTGVVDLRAGDVRIGG